MKLHERLVNQTFLVCPEMQTENLTRQTTPKQSRLLHAEGTQCISDIGDMHIAVPCFRVDSANRRTIVVNGRERKVPRRIRWEPM